MLPSPPLSFPQVLVKSLSDHNYETDVASNGREACDKLGEIRNNWWNVPKILDDSLLFLLLILHLYIDALYEYLLKNIYLRRKTIDDYLSLSVYIYIYLSIYLSISVFLSLSTYFLFLFLHFYQSLSHTHTHVWPPSSFDLINMFSCVFLRCGPHGPEDACHGRAGGHTTHPRGTLAIYDIQHFYYISFCHTMLDWIQYSTHCSILSCIAEYFVTIEWFVLSYTIL